MMPQHPLSTSALYQSIADNGMQALKQLLAQRTHVNAKNHSEKTPLHLAALLGLEGFYIYILWIDIKDDEGITPRD